MMLVRHSSGLIPSFTAKSSWANGQLGSTVVPANKWQVLKQVTRHPFEKTSDWGRAQAALEAKRTFAERVVVHGYVGLVSAGALFFRKRDCAVVQNNAHSFGSQ